MNSGKLRHKIIIQRAVETQDSIGEPDVTWTNYAVMWASMEPLKGREFYESKQINADITYRFVTRYKSGVIPKMRIKHGSRVFDITDVIDLGEQNKILTILAIEDV